MDLALLQAAHGWVARSPEAFFQALAVSDRPSWILGAMALVGMWFVTNRRQASRDRVALLFVALAVAFVAARVAAKLVHRLRPIATVDLPVPIPPDVWAQVKAGLQMQGAFPSDHAAMYAVIVTGLFATDRRMGVVSLLVALFFSVVRVGVGFHWPSDILGGAVIGAAAALAALALRRPLQPWLDPLMAFVERHAAWTYALLFLVIFDFTQRFEGLFGFLASTIGLKVVH